MYRLINAVLIICLVAKLHSSYGYKWIASKSGDPIPENAVPLNNGNITAYVGRARHVNLVLPAEITNEGATIRSTSNFLEIKTKNEYEVLVANEECKWMSFNELLTEKIVRAGSAWNGEPIFVGRLSYPSKIDYHVEPIVFSSRNIKTYQRIVNSMRFLMCEDNNKWVDSSSGTIPYNAVGGGISIDYKKTFFARLMGPSFFISGQITLNSTGMATATYNRHKISSIYYQVLVGDTNEYSWKFATNGEIPSYAVAAGISDEMGLIYVSRLNNKALGFLTFQEAVNERSGYEILVKNVE